MAVLLVGPVFWPWRWWACGGRGYGMTEAASSTVMVAYGISTRDDLYTITASQIESEMHRAFFDG